MRKWLMTPIPVLVLSCSLVSVAAWVVTLAPVKAFAQQVVPGRNYFLAIDGTAARPSGSFERDTDTGSYRPAANTWAVSTAGSQRLSVSSTAVISTVPVVVPDGTTSAVSAQFGSANTGIYKTTTANMPALVSNGTVIAAWRSAGEGFIIGSTQPLSWSSGTPGSAGADTVISRTAANTAAWAAGDYSGHVGVAFASLAASANGIMTFCTDCTKATPCAGGGGGALAVRIGGAWDCNP